MKTAVIALLLLLASACARQEGAPAPGGAAATQPTAPTIRRHADTPGIDWYSGEVADAFAAARAEHKPILLYWGAIWCPPCQQLKSTVFSRPDFIAKTRLFVPVYLDGDDPGAQKWGEQFQVLGYPTLLVLDADQHEIMRIAGSMDLSLYAGVLDTALADLQPAGALLNQALAGHALDVQQCRRLAFNGWALDELETPEQGRRAGQLASAAIQCPHTAIPERARLMVIAAGYQGGFEADALKAGKPPSAVLRAQVAAVGAILANERQSLLLIDALQYLDEGFFRAVKASSGASAWLAHFSKVMDAAAADPDYAEADQLGAVASKLQAIKIISGAIPSGAARAARARVDAALAGSQIPYVRSGLVNAALGIFDVLGQNDQAYRILQNELGRSATPYYYEADLGELAEGLGRKSEALDWFEKSYRDANGTATRFQWGARYVTGLLKLAPTDDARIRTVTSEVLGELDGPDRIYRRARLRLERLDKALRKWNETDQGAHAEVLSALRARMAQICMKIPAAEAAHGSCEAFLSGA